MSITTEKNDLQIVKIAGFDTVIFPEQSIFIVLASTDHDPSDYIENIYADMIKRYKNIDHIYIDMSYIYGKYGEWLWKCSFISNDNNELEDVNYNSLLNIDLEETEDYYISKYIHNNSLIMVN